MATRGSSVAEVKVVRQGVLSMQGRWRNWRKRWFVLDSDSLSFYRSEEAYNDNESALETCSIKTISVLPFEEGSTSFSFASASRVFNLRSDGLGAAEDWVRCVQSMTQGKTSTSSSIYDHLMGDFGMAMLPTAFIMRDEKDENLTPWEIQAASSGFTNGLPEAGTGAVGGLLSESLNTLGMAAALSGLETLNDDDAKQPTAVAIASDDLVKHLVGVHTTTGPSGLPLEEYRKCFLLYHKCFLKDGSAGLLSDLLNMFSLPFNLYADALVCATLRLKVLEVLQLWITRHPSDFSRSMRKNLKEFMEKQVAMVQGLEGVAASLEKGLRRLEKKQMASVNKLHSKVLKFVEPVDLLNITATDLAHQLTLHEYEMFQKIDMRELVNREWNREKTAELKAPVVTKMKQMWNQITCWVASEILRRYDNEGERRKVLRLFVSAGYTCLELRNFWGAFEIASALSLSCIFRLKPDWNSLPSKSKFMYKRLVEVTGVDGNYTHYREAYRNGLGKAQIPHLVLHLRDLFGFDSLDTYDEAGEIYFYKYAKQWRQMDLILRSQETEYSHLKKEEGIQLALLKAADLTLTREQMFEYSYKALPKQSKKKKKKK